MTLESSPDFPRRSGPVALIIMDGVGVAPPTEWNAVTSAHTPYLDKILSGTVPNIHLNGVNVKELKSITGELDASGKSVGLPSMGDMGNSEVGHNAMGAGRVYDQGAKLVNRAFDSGEFRKEKVWKWLVEGCKEGDGCFHMIGLYSDGNVHAHVNHVFKLVDAAIDDGVKKIRLHVLADGRDVSERSVLTYVRPLEKRLENFRETAGVDVRIASGGGRMVTTMDRYEANWDIVNNGWKAHVLGDTDSLDSFTSYSEAVQHYYDSDPKLVDQYMPPFVIVEGDNKEPVGSMQDGDSVLFWNFRGDRAIEISKALEAPEGEFDKFDRKRVPKIRYAGVMQYDGDAGIPKKYVVSPPSITRTVGEYAVKNGRKRFSISETQKYGHVTYFYNGNRAAKFNEEKELYTCIPSYSEREDTRPWMRCAEVTDEALKQITEFKPDLVILNYANGDMVGHTGHTAAARIAMECIDLCLSRIIPGIIKADGVAILTADHGNCDIMAEVDKKSGEPKPGSQPEGWKALTSHTTQRVPVAIVGKSLEKYEFNDEARWSATDDDCKRPGIANLGATVLNLLGFKEPEDFLPPVLKVKESS